MVLEIILVVGGVALNALATFLIVGAAGRDRELLAYRTGFLTAEEEQRLLRMGRAASVSPPPGYESYRLVEERPDLPPHVFARPEEAEFAVTCGNCLETGRAGWYRCIPVEPHAILAGDRRAIHPSIFNRAYKREGA